MSFISRSHWQRGVLTLVCVWLLASCNDENHPQPATPTATVPNVVGMTEAAAATTLKAADLVLGTAAMQSSATVPSGAIISQSVAPGVIVSPGTSVNVAVSSGAVAVPNVVGLTQSAAAAALTGAGLALGSVTPASSTTVPAGIIVSQTPSAASKTVSGSGVNVMISVGPPASYAYVAERSSISAYSINAVGLLTPLAISPISVPGSGELYETKIDPSGKFLYSEDHSAPGGVYAFSINQSDGSLVALNGGLPYPTSATAQSLEFDATGSFLYVLNFDDNSISAFSLNQSTGELAALATYPIAASNPNAQPRQMVRAGSYLYVAEYATNAIEVFSISAITGALTQGVMSFTTDTGPHSLAVDPSGALLYAANIGALGKGSISPFTINSSTGMLTSISAQPLAIPAFNQISVDSEGKFLFVTEYNKVAAFPIAPGTGELGSPIFAPAFAAGSNPYSVSVDLTDQFVYVADEGLGTVSEFAFDDSTGAMTPLNGSPISSGPQPLFVAIL